MNYCLTFLLRQQLPVNERFNILLVKLKRFKTKFYLNKLLRGLILSATILLVAFLIVDLFEYYSWSNEITRATIFYLFIVLMAGVLGFQVLIPVFHLLRMGKQLSHKEAAIIIGNHFPEISDKLLNTLQLYSAVDKENSDKLDLLLAGIEQRTNQLQPIPFRKAISFKSNYKYLKLMSAPLLILLLALIVSPAFVTEPAKRIVNHNSKFEKPQPYRFSVLNDSLVGVKGDEFTVLVKVEGDEIPQTVYLNDGKYDYRVFPNGNGILQYTFNKLKSDVYFKIVTEEVVSQQYYLRVLPKPSISSFNILLEFPHYIGKKDILVKSTGDVVVPEGTILTWQFYTNNSSEVVFIDDKQNRISDTKSDNFYNFSKKAKTDFSYSFYSISEHGLRSDTMNYNISVISDERPKVVIHNMEQEYLAGYLLVNGMITDDYGFSSLWFYYRKHENEKWQKTRISIDNDVEKQNFNHSFNTSEINLKPGEKINFYYEVWDNDGVNGYKSSKTSILEFNVPSRKDIEDNADSTRDLMKSKYEMSLKDLDEVSKELEDIKKSIFEKKNIDWQDKDKVKELIKSEREIRESLMEMEELNSKRDELKEFLNENPNESLNEKLKELSKQIEKLKKENGELLRKLEEMAKDIDEMSKDQLDKLLNELKENQEDFKESLEQQLEFFKQLELEQKLGETTEDLNELAKKEEKLAKETKNRENKLKEATKEQNKLNKEFEEIKEQLREIDSLNNNLEKPLEMQTAQEQQKEIEEEMQESSDNLSSGKRKKAGQSQTSAAQKMKDMADKLNAMMQEAMQSRMGEDIEQVKKILDNLIDISFSLEDLFGSINITSENDPQFVENTTQLKILKDDYTVLHDSLIEISKRQVMLQRFLVRESGKIESYFEQSLSSIQERQGGKAASQLQYGMTSANNLALMLDESLKQMQQSMNSSGSKSGDQKCKQPGSGESSGQGLKQMLKMQQGLGEGMKKSGKQQGKGSNNGQGQDGDSQELARMAAQQRELRKQMQQMMDELNGDGGSGSALQKIIDQMEKQEQDIINRRITAETLQRQKDIETRLLQAEKALMEREKEKKREATEGKKRQRGNNIDEIGYKDISIDNRNSIINTKPIKLSEPYKKLLEKYLYEIENEK